MSASLRYYAFGLKGVKYIHTKYKRGCTVFSAETTPIYLDGIKIWAVIDCYMV